MQQRVPHTMDCECDETIVRYVRLRDELKPVRIYTGDPPEPINPDWVAVTHAVLRSRRRPDGIEQFCLAFFMDDGQRLTWEQFETLHIAIDQATSIVGILPDEWYACRVEIVNDDGTMPWSDVA
ncbi:MAG: hypothetical protein HQ582_33330 [Planctomycetes bacterium]|nr:hypothetical protein [Planctomycetota bacterium]